MRQLVSYYYPSEQIPNEFQQIIIRLMRVKIIFYEMLLLGTVF